MYTVVTHSGSFHADDVFAVAAFQLLLGSENMQIIRTRDESIIATGDYVVDVGGVYDHAIKRYDHHQPGAPVRENGIPYSGFGLVWHHYGEEIAGTSAVADAIETSLVLPIDAGDNGVSLFTVNEYQIRPFELYQIISSYAPAWNSGESKDQAFLQAVAWAKSLLQRLIKRETAKASMLEYVQEVYDSAHDKRVLIFDKPVSQTALIDYPEVELIVCPDDPESNDNWVATAVRESHDTFAARVSFPESWAGLREDALAVASGIEDAVFCHLARFVFVAKSQDSVLRAAQEAH